MENRITLFGRINWTTYGLRTIKIQDAIEMIKTGSYLIDDKKQSGYSGTLREITEKIQSLPEGTDLKLIKAQFLPAVSFNGVYNNGIVKYSNYTALDFDHIPTQEEFTDLYLHLMNIPCVAYIYRTPSGKGLKALVIHDNNNPDLHGNLYRQLMEMFQTPYIKTDTSCKDLSRRNYLCYDPYVWINPNPIPYHYTPTLTSHSNLSKQQKQSVGKSISDKSIINIMNKKWKEKHPEYWKEGNRATSIFSLACMLCRWGVDKSLAMEYFVRGWTNKTMTEDEIVGHIENAYKKEANNYGKEIFQFIKKTQK